MNHAGRLPVDNKKTPIGFKWCIRCAETKKLDEFDSRVAKRKGKLLRVPQYICKECDRKRPR